MAVRLYLDTEFTDFPWTTYNFDHQEVSLDFSHHHLMSMAFYGGSDDTTFYGELTDFPLEVMSGFVKMNVRPLMDRSAFLEYDTSGLRSAVGKFLYQFEDQGVELLFDSHYDWDFFNKLMIDPIPFVVGRNIEGRIDRKKFRQFFKDNRKLKNHHALHDTMAQHHSYDPNYVSSASDAG